MNFKDKKVLITGSTKGIGFALAEKFAKLEADVFVNGTKKNAQIMALSENFSNIHFAMGDLSESDCAEKLYDITGNVDFLILNASIQYRNKWDKITDEEMDKLLSVNFKSSVKLIQKYGINMKANKYGRIITVGSVQQLKPHEDMLIYAASKAALSNVVMNLAKQFAPFGITVNNVAPGVIETSRNTEALSNKEYAKNIINGIPMRYIGQPCDCVGQIALLCSEEGRYITGKDFFIDGGMSL